MSLRGARFPRMTAEGIDGPTVMNTLSLVGLVGGLVYIYNLRQKKDHYVSKRGKIANNIGHTQLNEQIGKKNVYAHRMKKLFAGGKYDYSKNSHRDKLSTLYRGC